MAHDISTYLNDHLAGATTALELLDFLAAGKNRAVPGNFVASLREEILADRNELQALMKRLGVTESLPRRAAAWAAVKMAEVKLKVDDPSGGGLRLLEILEALSLGIEGKHLLWKSLSTAAAVNQGFQAMDFQRLM